MALQDSDLFLVGRGSDPHKITYGNLKTKLEEDGLGPDGEGITDAPINGKQYGRQDGAWTEITGGGGGVTGDYVKLNDAGTPQTIVGGGGIDLAGPLDVDGKVRINSDSVITRDGLAVNGDIGFNAANYTFRLFRSNDLASTDYTFLGLSSGSSDFEIRKSGGWGTRVYMYVDTSNRIHLSNDNNSGAPDVIGTTTAMVHAHGGLNAEFGTDTAQLGNVAPMNDWSCYPARV